LRRLAFAIGRAVRSPSPDAVHDLRVAVRRFQQALVIFAPCFPAKDTKKTGRRLKKLMALAGEVRNCDVAARLLSRSGKDPALDQKISAQRKQACTRLTMLLKRQADRHWYTKWRARLAEADAAIQPHFSHSVIESVAGEFLPRMAKEFFTNGDRAAETKASARKLHHFRIAAKKFRYTLELLEPVYGPGLRARLEPIRALQSLLGDVNDCRTARDLIAAWQGSQEFDARLRRRQRRKAREFAALWNETLAGPKQARQWIQYLRRVDARTLPKKGAARASSAAAASQVA
jgi:CHAD domain-containing protein